MFEDATFHSRGIQHDKTPQSMLFALGVNLTILVALILIPLLNPQSISSHMLSRVFFAPLTPTTPTHPQQTTTSQSATATLTLRNPFQAPRTIPLAIRDDAPPPPDSPFAALASVPGAISTPPFFPHANPPAVHPAAPSHATISLGVAQGLLLNRVTPTYPAIARAMGEQGTVVLAATISRDGVIENLRVLTGPSTLRIAAQEAVAQWRYRPYLLNGQPVEVETTINVVFAMTSH